MSITPKIASANYVFELNGPEDQERFSRLLEREDKMLCGQQLNEELEGLSWLREVDYSGTLGPRIFVEGLEDPTPQRLSAIIVVIKRHLSKPRLPGEEDLAPLDRKTCLRLLNANPRLHEPVPDRDDWTDSAIRAELWAELNRWDNPGLIEATWRALGWGDVRAPVLTQFIG